MRFCFLLMGALAVASLIGCRSDKPREATDAELAPVDQDPNATVPKLTSDGEPTAPWKPTPPPIVKGGPIVTLIYVTEIGNRDAHRIGATIFSSDPDCPYFEGERPRPSRVLKPTDGPTMQRLLDDLRKAGVGATATTDQKLTDDITRERQIIVIRDGTRVRYAPGEGNAFQLQAFNRCETVLVRYCSGSATFIDMDAPPPLKR